MSQGYSKSFQKVVFVPEAHKKLLEGAEVLFNAVKSTMGPSGHSVIISSEHTSPLITKDGVTVAKSINLKEKLPSIGAELIKEVASKTNEIAGDGSTTATVLGYSLLHQGVKMAATGRSTIGIKRGMDFACGKIVSWLKSKAIAVRSREDIVNIGAISANGDRQIGELLADAIERVGDNGIITIEPAKSVSTTLEVVEGMQIDSGYLAPYFVTNQEKLSCELNEPLILVTNKKINNLQECLPFLEKVSNEDRPLLLIGDEIEGEVLHTLIVNKMQGRLFCCAIKAPSYGENRSDILQDIALITGATVFDSSNAKNLKNVTLEDFGTCKKVIVTRTNTTFVTDGNEELAALVKERADSLKTLLATDTTVDDLKRSQIRKRLAKLAGGVAIVKVGGSTEVEILEKKDRVEDALNATLAAVQEGILPGGGIALFYAAQSLQDLLKTNSENLTEDELAGVRVVYNAVQMPLRVIVENTGRSADVVMNTLETKTKYVKATEGCECNRKLEFGHSCPVCRGGSYEHDFRFGYDAYRHKFCDLVDEGIIDPLKVERCSLEHATSVIGLVLTSNCVVVEEDNDSENNEGGSR